MRRCARNFHGHFASSSHSMIRLSIFSSNCDCTVDWGWRRLNPTLQMPFKFLPLACLLVSNSFLKLLMKFSFTCSTNHLDLSLIESFQDQIPSSMLNCVTINSTGRIKWAMSSSEKKDSWYLGIFGCFEILHLHCYLFLARYCETESSRRYI